MPLQTAPVARTQMLIRQPIELVFRAFVDPALTSRFWFSRGSGILEEGKTVTWYWDRYGFSVQVLVRTLEPDRKIRIEWPTPVEWSFEPFSEDSTLVSIEASGFLGTLEQQVAQAIDTMGGFSFALAGCKAFMEHGIALKLTEDHSPVHAAPRATCEQVDT